MWEKRNGDCVRIEVRLGDRLCLVTTSTGAFVTIVRIDITTKIPERKLILPSFCWRYPEELSLSWRRRGLTWHKVESTKHPAVGREGHNWIHFRAGCPVTSRLSAGSEAQSVTNSQSRIFTMAAPDIPTIIFHATTRDEVIQALCRGVVTAGGMVPRSRRTA
jgi:hypothetical protein